MDKALLYGVLFGVIAFLAATVVAKWKVFKKMGEPGWKSLIPFYSSYIIYKRVWNTDMYWLTLLLFVATEICSTMLLYGTGSTTSMLFQAGEILFALAAFVMSVIKIYRLAKAFHHGVGYTLGLLFLDPFFMMGLGYGRSEYSPA